jgi:hypothetical protein
LKFVKTNLCESIFLFFYCQECFYFICLSNRTKVRGSKTIRYRPSLNHKRCRLGIGGRAHSAFGTLREIISILGSGGSMVARLKLKGIDGRAPPGVELAAQFDSTREILPGPDIGRKLTD